MSPALSPEEGSPHLFFIRPSITAIQGLGSCLGSPKWCHLTDGTSMRVSSRWWTGVSQAGRHKTNADSPREGPGHLQARIRGNCLSGLLVLLVNDLLICSEIVIKP